MKKLIKKSLVALILVFGPSFILTSLPTVSQATDLVDTHLTYKGRQADGQEVFELDTDDLLKNFKQLIPGDQKKRTVAITNETAKKVKIYLALVSSNALEEDFLSELKLTLSQGSSVVYTGDMHRLTEQRGLLLGSFKGQETKYLTIDLTVPLELDNRFNGYHSVSNWVFNATSDSSEEPPTSSTEPPTSSSEPSTSSTEPSTSKEQPTLIPTNNQGGTNKPSRLLPQTSNLKQSGTVAGSLIIIVGLGLILFRLKRID